MTKIEERFNAEFSSSSIELPADDVANHRRGKIVKGGWAIWYLFAADDNGQYLDYYASHRMTSDTHARIYADGREQMLPTIREIRRASRDPEKDKRLEAEFQAENRAIAKLLSEKGFGLAGDEPGGVQMNRILRVDGMP